MQQYGRLHTLAAALFLEQLAEGIRARRDRQPGFDQRQFLGIYRTVDLRRSNRQQTRVRPRVISQILECVKYGKMIGELVRRL